MDTISDTLYPKKLPDETFGTFNESEIMICKLGSMRVDEILGAQGFYPECYDYRAKDKIPQWNEEVSHVRRSYN